MKPVSPEAIVAEARTWIDVPFAHQGKTRGGVDCLGLVFNVFSAFADVTPSVERHGRAAELFHCYKEDAPHDVLGRMLAHFFHVLPKREAQIGDALWIRRLQHPQHLGILADNCGRTIIHALRNPGRVIEQPLDDRYWDVKVVAALRLKDT